MEQGWPFYFLLLQQSAGRQPLGWAEGQDFVSKNCTAAPDLVPSAHFLARGQDLPLIDSLLPPFINIWPSNMAVWKSASPLRRKALRVPPDT